MTAVTREAVAWCAGCEWYIEAEQAGKSCPADECSRTLRRRVGYICRLGCEDNRIYFERGAFETDQREHIADAAIEAEYAAVLGEGAR